MKLTRYEGAGRDHAGACRPEAGAARAGEGPPGPVSDGALAGLGIRVRHELRAASVLRCALRLRLRRRACCSSAQTLARTRSVSVRSATAAARGGRSNQ